jgi:hypothetical protein
VKVSAFRAENICCCSAQNTTFQENPFLYSFLRNLGLVLVYSAEVIDLGNDTTELPGTFPVSTR